MRLLPMYALLAIGSLAVPLVTAAKSGPAPLVVLNSVYPQAVSNGVVRVQPTYFGPGSNEELGRPADSEQREYEFSATVWNQGTKRYVDAPRVELKDANDVMADPRRIAPSTLDLPAGGVATLYVYYWAPKDFVPDHVAFSCRTVRCKPLLIKFRR